MLAGDLRDKIKNIPDNVEVYFTCCTDPYLGHTLGDVEERTVDGKQILLVGFTYLSSATDIDLEGGC